MAAKPTAHPEHPLDPALWSPAELQEAVDLAAFLRLIDSARRLGDFGDAPELDSRSGELIRTEACRRGIAAAPADALVRRYVGGGS